MGVEVKLVDVNGRFESVTGQHRLSLTVYHKRKNREPPLQATSLICYSNYSIGPSLIQFPESAFKLNLPFFVLYVIIKLQTIKTYGVDIKWSRSI